ncbi:MAG: MFS transporter [Streptosporangiaceae bacterium]|nr:MFS transporter [Streptosporangiaceae bacterium]MBV9856805.1 MFS transporter [Streptosporangiaceae bacterium]
MLQYRMFRWYFAGSVLSNTGTWLQNTAQVLLIYRLTHSVMAVGLVTSAQFSSPLFVGPLAGMLTERKGYYRVLISTQSLSAAIAAAMAGLEFSGVLGEEMLIGGALLIGILYTLSVPALSSMVPALVPEHETKAAMALNVVSYNLGRALAPAIGVVMVFTVGFGWAFTLNAASFVILVAAIALIRHRNPDTGPAAKATPRSGVLDGFRVSRDEPRILALLAIVAAVTIAADPILVLGPAVGRHLAGTPNASAYFISAMGAGYIVGSLVPTGKPSFRQTAVFLWLLCAGILLFAFGPTMAVSLAGALTVGIASLLEGAATQALLISLAGPSRVPITMAIWMIAWAGSKPIASLADGYLATVQGVRTAAVVLILPVLLLSLGARFCPMRIRERTWPGHASGRLTLSIPTSRLMPRIRTRAGAKTLREPDKCLTMALNRS